MALSARPSTLDEIHRTAPGRSATGDGWLTLVPTEPDDGPEDPNAWKVGALCAQTDPDIFYPEKGGSVREAKALCRQCPITQRCLEEALANREVYGIWGAMTSRERHRLIKARDQHNMEETA